VFARKLKERGITDMSPARGRILFVLWKNDGIPVQELAARTGLEPSTLTRMLDRLEESGHIRREAWAGDRRKVLIHLTGPHQDLRPLYDEVSAEMTGLFYRGLAPSEVTFFESCLERILGNLEALDGTSQGEGVKTE
jgi:DNA-binding MarR family transcriptional regulator